MVRSRKFKREYIPVIIAVIVLILLITALVFVIRYEDPTPEEELLMPGYQQEEMVVDNSGSKCSTEELKSLLDIAKKVEFESKEVPLKVGTAIRPGDAGKDVVDSYVPAFELTLKNMTDDLYVIVSNSIDTEQTIVNKASAKDGVYKFYTKNSDKLVTYTLEIRSNKYNCVNEVIRKFTFITPIYNVYSNTLACEMYPDMKYCGKFIAFDTPSMYEFRKALEEYEKEQGITKTTTTKADGDSTTSVETTTTKAINKEENKKDNKTIIYIASAVILIGVVATVTTILVKKKRSKSL